MFDHTSEEIDYIVQKAKHDDNDAKKAAQTVYEAISQMTPGRQYNKDKSRNKR